MSNSERNDVMNLQEVTDVTDLHLEKSGNIYQELEDFCIENNLTVNQGIKLLEIVSDIRQKDLDKYYIERLKLINEFK